MTERFEMLSGALDLRRGETVAFVGAGGKTSAILTAAAELSRAGWRVLVSTTTRVGPRMAHSMPSLVMVGERVPDDLRRVMDAGGRVFVSAGVGADGKHIGLDPWTIDSVRERAQADVALVEADGARHLPLKAPDEHEPRIPASAAIVVPMAGLDALGLPVAPGSVHRPGLVRAIALRGSGSAERTRDSASSSSGPGHSPADVESGPGLLVTPELIGAVLTSCDGGLKAVPPSARVVPLLNKADAVELDSAARAAASVLSGAPDIVRRVVIASIRDSRYAAVSR